MAAGLGGDEEMGRWGDEEMGRRTGFLYPLAFTKKEDTGFQGSVSSGGEKMRRWRLLSKLPIFTRSYRRQTACQLAFPCVRQQYLGLLLNCLLNRMEGQRNFKGIWLSRRGKSL
jgi:hypothetical protein